MQTRAVILERPERLSLGDLDLVEPGASDIVVAMKWTGISTGTEKLLWRGEMPWFPGLEYPLVPGYEGVGDVVARGADADIAVGTRVFVPGANCYAGARGLFGASASKVVVAANRVTPVDDGMGEKAILLSLAATAQHAISPSKHIGPTLVVGHGVVGRLLARLLIARGDPPPTVWEIDTIRAHGGEGYGYEVVAPDQDEMRTYATIIDASGDPGILDTLVAKLAPQGEIILAGFYAKPLSFAFPPAFMREARFRVAAEWKPDDLDVVRQAIADDRLSLADLITHRRDASEAESAYETAFTEPACLKMVLDWSSTP